MLELGVGYTMPELIRFPFEQIVMNHKRAKLIRINTNHPLCVEENNHKAICVVRILLRYYLLCWRLRQKEVNNHG